ncbi:MAG: glycosyltransferase [Chitinophagaceae bacterium]|nr:glycosyltransferase [Chitinophagaceae bacterium]
MQLSVIIVNYNVKHFLEQCLCSVQKAIEHMQAEIIVVDNNSTDNSLSYLQPKFPAVKFIANKENTGFAKGCNQGLAIATGAYVLFLNPDTVVPEDCFQKCISFFELQPLAGAVGVKMLDGSGKFLKESKRAFPSPFTSLYKLFGLSKLFPRSKSFSRYHLGHLDENQINEIDVLAGAFMMIKKEVLDKVGSFDETFFMYGEDVDLSYRIQKAGYKNFYFPETQILHFKGESTRKGSMNYVRMFYNAMRLFVRKHYTGTRAGFFNFLIYTAIWIRAGLSAIGHFISRIGLPLLDAALILLSFLIMKWVWGTWIRPETEFEERLVRIAFPAYTLFFLLTAYYAGLYDRWYKRKELINSMLVATIILLAGYALLPEHLRFSRGILLFGSMLAFVFISLFRWILISTGVLQRQKEKEEGGTTMIAATAAEYGVVTELIKQAGLKEKILGRIAVTDDDKNATGSLSNLISLSGSIPFKELIFCQGKMSFSTIINTLPQLPVGITAMFHASGSQSIVGSDSKDSSGESVSNENGFNLSSPYNQRLKRLIDIVVSIAGLLTFPLHLFIVKKPISFFSNCFSVLAASKTWVGYATDEKHLPRLRQGILGCNGTKLLTPSSFPVESLKMVDYWYARDYEPSGDIKIIWKMYRHLGG